jgi:hypothetical protein
VSLRREGRSLLSRWWGLGGGCSSGLRERGMVFVVAVVVGAFVVS